jgi:4-hydroxy-tetrahydrodipicolinate synthase
MNHLTGSMVAIITPFNNGEVDTEALKALVDFHVDNGTDVIVPCGTTGESATLTHAEHDLVIQTVVDQAKGKLKILAGAGSNATHEAIRLNQSAAKIGVDATLHITPYYNKPNQEGLYQHYQAIAESADIPIILYNVPSRTAVNLLPETVARLSKIKNIIGIKEACGNLDQIKKVKELCPDDFLILSGEDAQNFEILELGGVGMISVTANIAPDQLSKMWKEFQSGNLNSAKEIHQNLMELHDHMFIDTNPIPVKSALSLMGKIVEEYRLPMVKISDEKKVKLKEILEKYSLI